VYELYNAEQSAGLPMSLQIVGRRHMDEKVLAALMEIELALGRT
jgi:Asp-tRNA(Asn)/Glu-tRNA(Gln) amidotransferase A subunit family amidase